MGDNKLSFVRRIRHLTDWWFLPNTNMSWIYYSSRPIPLLALSTLICRLVLMARLMQNPMWRIAHKHTHTHTHTQSTTNRPYIVLQQIDNQCSCRSIDCLKHLMNIYIQWTIAINGQSDIITQSAHWDPLFSSADARKSLNEKFIMFMGNTVVRKSTTKTQGSVYQVPTLK